MRNRNRRKDRVQVYCIIIVILAAGFMAGFLTAKAAYPSNTTISVDSMDVTFGEVSSNGQ